MSFVAEPGGWKPFLVCARLKRLPGKGYKLPCKFLVPVRLKVCRDRRRSLATSLAAAAAIPTVFAFQPSNSPLAERLYVMTNTARQNQFLAFE